MGFHDEFKQAVKACEKIGFSITGRRSASMCSKRRFDTLVDSWPRTSSAEAIPTLLNKAIEVTELIMCGVRHSEPDAHLEMELARVSAMALGELLTRPR